MACSNSLTSQSVDIIVAVPKSGYVWDGKPTNAVLIMGHTKGYQSKAFRAALDQVRFNFQKRHAHSPSVALIVLVI